MLETELGTTQLGLDAQLKEIEKGFADLLAQRPEPNERRTFRRLPNLASHLFHHCRWRGRVTQVVGNLVESAGPFCSVGESCEIVSSSGATFPGEIVGFRGSNVLSMSLEKPQGIRFGDQIVTWGARPSLRVGPELLGRVIDATGRPLDTNGDYSATRSMLVDGTAPLPLERTLIDEPLSCGIRAVDGFLTCGRGQRIGIFGGSGVGKSTLIGMMARGTAADLTVLALVGERGREVGEFLNTLGRRWAAPICGCSFNF